MSSIVRATRPLIASGIATTSRSAAATSSSSSSSSTSHIRSFSTTPPWQTKTIKPHRLPSDLIPPYPYGERRIYKQSNQGLYGHARIRFGNTVAPKHKQKSRRFWRPNVHVKVLPVPSIGARVKTRLTLRVLKTIRKEGGLENYLLKDKPARVKEMGPGGWNLKWLLMQSDAVQARLDEQRAALGLEPRSARGGGAGEDVIQYALDYATPGPLSVRSRLTLEQIRAAVAAAADEYVLGSEDLSAVEDVKELSDEEEQVLLRGLDGEEVGKETDGNPKEDRALS